jgi:hypothetical protein
MARLFRVYAEADGWCTVHDLPGWESHAIAVRVAVVDGRARVTALRVESPPDAERGLTATALKSLPLGVIAMVALRAMPDTPRTGDLHAAMRKIAKRQAVPHDPRAIATVEQVAEVWRLAYAAGEPPRAAVCRQLHLSTRTADRYIARAREAGLITESQTRPAVRTRRTGQNPRG